MRDVTEQDLKSSHLESFIKDFRNIVNKESALDSNVELQRAFQSLENFLSAQILGEINGKSLDEPAGFAFHDFSYDVKGEDQNLLWNLDLFIRENLSLDSENLSSASENRVVMDIVKSYMKFIRQPASQKLKVEPNQIILVHPESTGEIEQIKLVSLELSPEPSDDLKTIIENFIDKHSALFDAGENKNDRAADNLNNLLKIAVLGVTDEGEHAQSAKFSYTDFSVNQKDAKGRKVNLLRLLDEHLENDTSSNANNIRTTIGQFIDPETNKLNQNHNKKIVIEPAQNIVDLDYTNEEPTVSDEFETPSSPLVLTPMMRVKEGQFNVHAEDELLQKEAFLQDIAMRLKQPFIMSEEVTKILAQRNLELGLLDPNAERLELSSFIETNEVRPQNKIFTAPPPRFIELEIDSEPPKIPFKIMPTDDNGPADEEVLRVVPSNVSPISSEEKLVSNHDQSTSFPSNFLKAAVIAGIAFPSAISDSEVNASGSNFTFTDNTSIGTSIGAEATTASNIILDKQGKPIATIGSLADNFGTGNFKTPISSGVANVSSDSPIITTVAPSLTPHSIIEDPVIDTQTASLPYQAPAQNSFIIEGGLSFSEVVAMDLSTIGGDLRTRYKAYVFANPELANNQNYIAAKTEINLPNSLENASKVKCDWEKIIGNLDGACSIAPQTIQVKVAKFEQ